MPSLDPVTGPRVPGSVLPGVIMYTALAYPDPDAPNTVLVLEDDGGNRFQPSSITVPVGGIVNWYWPVGSAGHNIVPDDGNAPATSGAPANYPKFLSFTFANPGGLPLSLCGARWSRGRRDVRIGNGFAAHPGLSLRLGLRYFSGVIGALTSGPRESPMFCSIRQLPKEASSCAPCFSSPAPSARCRSPAPPP